MQLTQACRREDLQIIAVNTDYRHKRHLENLSVMQGEDITCLYNRSGDIVIKVKDGRLAINREFAAVIEVESLNPEDYVSVERHPHLKKFVAALPLINRSKRVKAWLARENKKRVPTQEAIQKFKQQDIEYRKQEKLQKEQLKARKADLRQEDK